MEIMKKVAQKHGMICILSEKPFDGVNGSGKHNNWSISTDSGENLLEPGKTPEDNAQFLLILTAIIKAVDEHQDLLRISVASRGNDLRLGGNEAPPAIISMFLGDELTSILESIMNGTPYDKKACQEMKLGIDSIPAFPKDNTDRNRTSPFAFTGNKFEFRSLGSSMSISCTNVMIDTIVADTFAQFCDELENVAGNQNDFNKSLNELIKRTLNEHKRIIFNGDGYSEEWVKEAKNRGLLNLPTTTDALPYYVRKENIDLFARHGIYKENEVFARYEIQMEEYAKLVNIEVKTMLDLAEKEIIPAVLKYEGELCKIAEMRNRILIGEKISSISSDGATSEQTENYITLELIRPIDNLVQSAIKSLDKLRELKIKTQEIKDATAKAKTYTDDVLPVMKELRSYCDDLEKKIPAEYWPFPTYADILFQV